jgi:exodeoxyribonuclease VII small subunit
MEVIMAKINKSFEEAICELEVIVDRLEKGELPLDESIQVFQKGIELSKFCSKRLDEVERKISILLEDEKGEIKEEPFNEI